MKDSAARRVAFTGMLFALALALSWAEGLLTGVLGLPPGVKLGLANIVVMYALLFIGRGQALLLVGLKAGFALLTRGVMAGALSGAGGLCALLVMLPFALRGRRPAVLLQSVAGALAHNAGQLLVVWLWFGDFSLYYAPVLAVAAIVMGCLTAVLLRALLPALQATGVAQTPKKEEEADEVDRAHS